MESLLAPRRSRAAGSGADAGHCRAHCPGDCRGDACTSGSQRRLPAPFGPGGQRTHRVCRSQPIRRGWTTAITSARRATFSIVDPVTGDFSVLVGGPPSTDLRSSRSTAPVWHSCGNAGRAAAPRVDVAGGNPLPLIGESLRGSSTSRGRRMAHPSRSSLSRVIFRACGSLDPMGPMRTGSTSGRRSRLPCRSGDRPAATSCCSLGQRAGGGLSASNSGIATSSAPLKTRRHRDRLVPDQRRRLRPPADHADLWHQVRLWPRFLDTRWQRILPR